MELWGLVVVVLLRLMVDHVRVVLANHLDGDDLHCQGPPASTP